MTSEQVAAVTRWLRWIDRELDPRHFVEIAERGQVAWCRSLARRHLTDVEVLAAQHVGSDPQNRGMFG